MRNIVLVSHGTLAEGVYRAAKMIYGDLKNVDYLCLEENMDIESFRQKLSILLDNIKNSDEIVLLADLKGGSPYTSAATLLSEKGMLEKSVIISGLNLPLILTVLFEKNKLEEKALSRVINEARTGIMKFELENDDQDEL